MVMKYFWPEKDYSWEELDKITAKVESLWTWPTAGLLWLKTQGMEVKNIEVFDYETFVREGGKYLIDECGEEVGKAQIERSDIEQERRLAKEFIGKIEVLEKIPSIRDIKMLLEEGFVVICNINAYALDNDRGYAAHFVVVKGFDDENLFLHDPGLPPLENRKVDFDTFERGWSYPDEKSKNVMAFRLPKGAVKKSTLPPTPNSPSF